MTTPRLHLSDELASDARITLAREQAHYLLSVMRMRAGDELRVFNGRDGEWRARVATAQKREAVLCVHEQLREQAGAPDLHVLFAPLKKTRTDFAVEKASELGARVIRPVFTRYTQSERVNAERLQLLAREAAEQCERLDLPEIAAPERLDALLDHWTEREGERRLLFCNEAEGGAGTPWNASDGATHDALSVLTALRQTPPSPWAILIGPEGGFHPDERARLREASFAVSISLGPRILRADTAVVAAVTLWQAVLGDWR